MRLGVASFKIEGRLKTPEYVAAVTQVYRRAIDQAWEAGAAPADRQSRTDRYRLEMAFSRGLYSGWMHGVNHQRLVHARYGKKRGAFLGADHGGRTRLAGAGRARARRARRRRGDRPGRRHGPGTGRPRLRVAARGGVVRLGFEHGIDFRDVKPGDRLWKTDDPQLNRELRKSFAGEIAEAGASRSR